MALPHAKVFVSGAGEIGYVRLHLGGDIAAERTGIENRARSTFENARVRPRAGERWLLVTSATHMPRAVGAFRSVGFDVEPGLTTTFRGAITNWPPSCSTR